MEAPRKVNAQTAADYFSVLTKAVFQSGISWRVVEAKWDSLQKAMSGLDPAKVARLGPRDVDRLVEDPRVIRNRKKLEATIENARAMVDLEREHGSFRNYLRSHGGFEETVADLKRKFGFMGDTGAYYFLYVVGEKVPAHEAWMRSRGRELPARPPARGAERSTAKATSAKSTSRTARSRKAAAPRRQPATRTKAGRASGGSGGRRRTPLRSPQRPRRR